MKPIQSQLPRVVRFGIYEIDVRAGELRKSGVRLKLQEQPFQILWMLVEHFGEVVTREELRNRLWPADTFVDFDHGLNAAIKRLRDALGDSAENPRFVETVARRGYRFIAPLDRPQGPTVSVVPDRQNRFKPILQRPWVAIALLVPIVIGTLVWALWRHPSRHTGNIEQRLTANSWENPVSSAAISPDGRFLIYSDSTGLYQKLIRTGETHSVPLPKNFSARVDNWFPDGAHVLVTRREGHEKPSLWSIPVFGGSPHHLADDGARSSVSPDGSLIAFVRDPSSEERLGSEIWVMRPDGTDQVKVAPAPAQATESWLGELAWSPDGKQIAYIRYTSGNLTFSRSLELTEWQSARSQNVFSDMRLGSALRWLPDGRILYVVAEDASFLSDSNAWAITLRSTKILGTPTRITRGQGRISTITTSADGKLLAFVREGQQPHVYIGTLSGDGKQLLANRRLTLEESADIPFSWTPDSKAVLFMSDRNGTPEIFKQAIDEPLAESLVAGQDQPSLPRVSPDGSEILYLSGSRLASPPTGIFAIPIGGGAPRLVLKDVGIVNVQCGRLPSTVCLYSIFQGKQMKTFRFDVRNGQTTDLHQPEPAGNWSLSPDGSERAIAVLDPDNSRNRIQLRSTSTGETSEILVSGWSGFRGIDWSADGKSLRVVSQNHAGDTTLLNVRLDGSASVLIGGSNPRVGYAIPSPDGRFLEILEETGTSNVWLLEVSKSK